MQTRRSCCNLASLLILFLLLFAPATGVLAQDNAAFNADLQRAIQLVQSVKMPEAIPILERLNALNPDHVLVSETLAYALFTSAIPDQDADRRKATIIRARQLAEKAQKLGDNSQLLQLLLRSIPPNGEMPAANGPERTPAMDALAEGESAFSKGDLEGAIGHYERASKLDPAMYEAPLFIGDAYFKLGKLDEAAANYAKAIAINPDRDTAYRYWGDALLRAGQLKESREKMVEAVIADPYTLETWQYLSNWARRAGVTLGHPRLDLPKSAGDFRVSDTTDVWGSYALTRAQWAADDKAFKAAYPTEPRYRHSLREEVAALSSVVETVEARLKDGQLKEQALSPATANLLSLHRAGLLDAYVLLAMADEGIARDYPEYRKQGRDKLRRYLNEFVTGGK